MLFTFVSLVVAVLAVDAANVIKSQKSFQERFEFLSSKLPAESKQVSTGRPQFSLSAMDTGYLVFEHYLEEMCETVSSYSMMAYGTCVLNENGGTNMLVYTDLGGGNATASFLTFNSLDCDEATTTSANTYYFSFGSCLGYMASTGVTDSYSPMDKAVNMATYNSEGNCDDHNYDDVISADAVPFDGCYDGGVYSFQPTSCSRIYTFNTLNCTGEMNLVDEDDIDYNSCSQEDDNGEGDDFYSSAGDIQFERTSCSNAASSVVVHTSVFLVLAASLLSAVSLW